MRKSILTLFRSLFIAALTAGALWSCQDEKPEIILPDPVDPVIPQKEFRYVESLTPDTVKFKKIREQDSVIFNIRTIPYDLLKRDSVTVQVADTAGARYEFADISSYTLRSDSVWNIKTYINKGVKSGDIISIMVAVGSDTVMYSDPMVLYIVPVLPRAIESLAPDTISFNEGDSAVISIKTMPLNLLALDSVKIAITDNTGALYEYAQISSISFRDSIWNIAAHMKYGMKSGDVISLRISDEDTVMYTPPIVLNMIPKPIPVQYSIMIASDSISGFLDGGVATIRVKTAPWNVLFNDTVFSLALNDTLGNLFQDRLDIDSKEFVPDDSCWKVKIKVLDKTISKELVSVQMNCPDTVVSTGFVTLEKVSISMTSVWTGKNLRMSYDSKSNTFSYFLPTTTDFTAQQFMFYHNGDMVTIGDSVLLNDQYNTLNASKPITVSVWKYGVSKDFIVKLTNTGLPVVRINTGGKTITSRKDWVDGITIRIENPDGTLDYEGTLSMRGRGNGTWVENNNWNTPPKKPYAIRLDEKAKLLGMQKHKRWILLANYKDRTLMRNDAALWLSRQTDLPYTINGQFVELVWNGVHKGNYYLCEQAKIDNHRIDIPDPDLDNWKNGGVFLEIDTYYNYYVNDSKYPKKEELGFWSDYFKVPYIFKDPDETMITSSSATYTGVKEFINNLEASLMDDKRLKNHEYEQYLDVDKAIDFLLIQELTMNHDSYNVWPQNRPGPHSTFMYIDSIGKLCFGPLWDFDYHTFALKDENGNNNSRLTQWELLTISHKTSNRDYYFNRLKGDPEFKRKLIDRWDLHKNDFKQLPTYIRAMAKTLTLSEKANYTVWGAINNPNGNQNGDQTLSFDQAIENMIEAFNQRWDWIETKMGYYRNDINYH
jgi:hypothetical protein